MACLSGKGHGKNVPVMQNLEDITVKNIMFKKNIHEQDNFRFPTKAEGGGDISLHNGSLCL